MSNPLSVQAIPLSQIRPNPHQPRQVLSQEAIDLMAASLAEIGQQTPAKVRRLLDSEKVPGEASLYELIGGHIRFAGAQKAGLAALDCLVLDQTPEQAELAGLMDNQSTDMHWLDWVLAIERLYNAMPDKSQRKLGDQLGLTGARINQALKVANALTPVSRALIVKTLNTLGPDEAISQYPIEALAALGDPQAVEKALPVVLDRNLTQPQVKALVASIKAGIPADSFDPTAAKTASKPKVSSPATHATPHADSPIAVAKAPSESAQAMGSAETALYEAVAGMSVIAKIRSKIKKGERPNFFEVLLLAGYNLWHGLVWLSKNGFRLSKLAVKWAFKAVKFVWRIILDSLKVLGIYQFARAVVVIALLIALLICGWYVHTHGVGATVHLVYSKLWPASINTPAPTPAATLQPTVVAEAPTPVPTKVKVIAKAKPKPTVVPKQVVQITPNAKGNNNGPLAQSTHVAQLVASQQTPTPKPQGDLFTQGADAATKGANIAKAFGL